MKNPTYNSERIIPDVVPKNLLMMHLERYLFAKSFSTDFLVLDVASGAGYGSKLLTETAREVIGGDLSLESVHYGQQKSCSRKTSFTVLDCQELPFRDETFDVIISFETIEHLPNSINFLMECKRVLKKNGTLICSTCNKNILTAKWRNPLNPYHKREFSQEEFFVLLSNHFCDLEMYGQLFLGPLSRLGYMFYYTFGFLLNRLKILPLFQSLLKYQPENAFGSASKSIKKINVSKKRKKIPGYLVAVCKKKTSFI